MAGLGNDCTLPMAFFWQLTFLAEVMSSCLMTCRLQNKASVIVMCLTDLTVAGQLYAGVSQVSRKGSLSILMCAGSYRYR